jgi:hypothetical protein
MMTRTRAPVLYEFNDDPSREYLEAQAKEFPNAMGLVAKGKPRLLPSGLVSQIDRHDEVWVCPKCLEAQKNWKPRKS